MQPARRKTSSRRPIFIPEIVAAGAENLTADLRGSDSKVTSSVIADIGGTGTDDGDDGDVGDLPFLRLSYKDDANPLPSSSRRCRRYAVGEQHLFRADHCRVHAPA